MRIGRYLYAPDGPDPDLASQHIDFLHAIRSYGRRQRRHGHRAVSSETDQDNA